uniref:I-set domain-containing protein n=1 Tax=Panagrellus redivivus TaxID=6233 RepID=A0A7E4V7K9_PANRE
MSKATHPYFLRRPKVHLNLEDGTLTIKAYFRVRNHAKVKWFHDDNVVKEAEKVKIINRPKTSTLRIAEALVEQAGLYTVEVKDKAKNAKVRTSIRIKAKDRNSFEGAPTFITSNYFWKKSNVLVLQHTLKSAIDFQTQWDFKCEKKEKYRFREEVRPQGDKYQLDLEITNPDYNDVGQYNVLVASEAGLLTRLFILVGVDKIKRIEILGVNMFTATTYKDRGHTTIMEMKYQCLGSTQMEYNAVWIAPDKKVIRNSELRECFNTPDKKNCRIYTAMLKTSDYRPDQSGTYFCQLRNKQYDSLEAVGEFTLNISNYDDES